ncbi:MAG: alpha/beta hydrolase [Bryobacteraceae bacterium]|nr:alpha/beta hydrolase [Bryobacteraceae bacterium]
MLSAAFLLAFAAAAAAPNFDFDRKRPFDVKRVGGAERGDVLIEDITFANISGRRTAAYLVLPKITNGKSAGILYVHWYEPEKPTSNRTQFLEEAVALARKGTVSLLVETMWSDPKWFGLRKRENDFAMSVNQVKELRRALDLLCAHPAVDKDRVAYVGHDFGAMYGAVLAGLDGKRVRAWALQAGTTRFSDWFLYGQPRLEGDARQKFIDWLAPLDPIHHISAAAPSPVLFQFAHEDFHVPVERAKLFYEKAAEPKEIRWYGGGHGLDEKAVEDRKAWLTEKLRLGQ